MVLKRILPLLAAATMAVATQSSAAPVFNAASYTADVTFADALNSTSMTMAYDGTNYWSASGGSSGGNRYAQYNSGGGLVGTFAPGLDFRSVFTDAANNVYARQFNSNTIYKQSSPGTFGSFLSLTGGSLDAQSSVVLNSAGQFVAMQGGTVNVWSASGAFSNSFSLSGYTGNYPENRGIAAAGNNLFTYFNQTLSAWDYSGNLVDTATLTAAGTSFDSYFSISYANDRIFVVDNAGGTWRGYDIGVAGGNVPEPGTLALLALGLIAASVSRRRVKA